MACRLPVFSKCCFCVPLRPGLLVWGYFKLISAIVFLLLILLEVRARFSAKELAILFALLSLLVANVVFSCLFVVGAHRKNASLMKVYYTFSIFLLVLGATSFLGALGLGFYRWYNDSWYSKENASKSNVSITVSGVVDILLQIYFIALVRSVLLKLKTQRVRFANGPGEEARVALDVPETKEQDRTRGTVGSDSEEEFVLRKPLFPVKELERLKEDV